MMSIFSAIVNFFKREPVNAPIDPPKSVVAEVNSVPIERKGVSEQLQPVVQEEVKQTKKPRAPRKPKDGEWMQKEPAAKRPRRSKKQAAPKAE
jgi:hypothetical protein